MSSIGKDLDVGVDEIEEKVIQKIIEGIFIYLLQVKIRTFVMGKDIALTKIWILDKYMISLNRIPLFMHYKSANFNDHLSGFLVFLAAFKLWWQPGSKRNWKWSNVKFIWGRMDWDWRAINPRLFSV